MLDNIEVGKIIAKLRQNKGMTQQQLAAALNVSHQAVSKWETGAALPDVQTLMALTNLFGITVEQLLNGEVPEDRLGPKPASFDESIQNIGNFFNNIVNDIFHPEKKAPEAGDGAQDAEAQPAGDAPEATDDAPEEEGFDVQRLVQMAPFMSKAAVDAILLENKAKLSAADIAQLAPFVSPDCLVKLIQNSDSEINWDTLRRVAPFLKREAVDRLAKAAAKGGRFVKKAAEQSGINTDDLDKAIGDASQVIGTGVEKAIRKAAELGSDVCSGVSGAINDLVEGIKGDQARADALRRAACERALQDERWDWLAAHIDQIEDEEMLRAIAQKANGLGMHDWVLEHLNGYADTRTIEAAIENGDWGWLGDHVWQFEDELQEKIARAAAKAENWQWLSTYSEQISLENCGEDIALAAYKADARMLARQLAENGMNDAQRQGLADAAVTAGDFDFLDQLADLLPGEYFGRLCLARGQAGDWEAAVRYAGRADRRSLEQLMELAIADGNLDAFDLLEQNL